MNHYNAYPCKWIEHILLKFAVAVGSRVMSVEILMTVFISVILHGTRMGVYPHLAVQEV
jgi:hypothetical protein